MIYIAPEFLPEAALEKERYTQHNNSIADSGYINFQKKVSRHILNKIPRNKKGLDFGSGAEKVMQRILQEDGYSMTSWDPFFARASNALNEKYDFITCVEVTEHFHYPDKEFILLKNLLNPDGTLIIMTQFFYPEIDFNAWWYTRDFTHVCFYREETFHWIADRYNYEVFFPEKNIVILRQGSIPKI
ncbi:class I SAM-dependent methyltransferase [Candidatus Riflebacteria bacterium]